MTRVWAAIAPVHYIWDLPAGVSLPHQFAEGVTFSKLPQWVTSEDVLKYLGYSLRAELERRGCYCIAIDYKAEALGTPDPNWKESPPRSIQDAALESIQHVGLGLWLARPMGLGFSCVLHGNQVDHEWRMRQSLQVARFLPLPSYRDAKLEMADLKKAGDLFLALRGLGARGTLPAATQAAIRALTEKGWVLRFLIFWLALESLFGPEDAREITFRLSQRVAFFLANDSSEARQIFEEVKASYEWRSKVVHGLRLRKLTEEKSLELIGGLEEIVRRSILKILGDTTLRDRFESRDREAFLDGLVFAR